MTLKKILSLFKRKTFPKLDDTKPLYVYSIKDSDNMYQALGLDEKRMSYLEKKLNKYDGVCSKKTEVIEKISRECENANEFAMIMFALAAHYERKKFTDHMLGSIFKR